MSCPVHATSSARDGAPCPELGGVDTLAVDVIGVDARRADAACAGDGLSDLSGEALRVYRRYQRELVEELTFCPWAERARQLGTVQERVVLDPEPGRETLLAVIAELASDPRLEIGLILLPQVSSGLRDFERFVAALVEWDAARWQLGQVPFAMAAFHPFAPCDLSTPSRLVPFIRRTPDPTVQLVRVEVLERVRDGFSEGTHFADLGTLLLMAAPVSDAVGDAAPPGARSAAERLPLRERIARANLRTVQKLGVAALQARFDEIRQDRDVSYARFGVPPRVADERL